MIRFRDMTMGSGGVIMGSGGRMLRNKGLMMRRSWMIGLLMVMRSKVWSWWWVRVVVRLLVCIGLLSCITMGWDGLRMRMGMGMGMGMVRNVVYIRCRGRDGGRLSVGIP